MSYTVAPWAHVRMSGKRRLLLYCLAAALALGLALVAQVQTASAEPLDTPVPVVLDNVEEWSAGAGLLYWGYNCFADEFNPFAALKRKPARGGAERTLESINDGALCINYRSQLSTGDGLYYFDYSQSRIERMPLNEPYTPQVIKALDAGQFPAGRALVLAGGYLYWPDGIDQVLRVAADGGGKVESVANNRNGPVDLLVVGNTVYFTDANGVWMVNVNCATLPCGDPSQFAEFGANTTGYGLLYQPLGGPTGIFRIYWVERVSSGPDNNYQIRYRSCNQLTVCVLFPLPPAEIFYGSTVNWHIGRPALANGNLYWTEANTGSNGDVKRRAYNAAAPGADTLATEQANLDDRLYVVNGLIFFARRAAGIYTLPLDATAILRDLAADALEVTQGIQNLANAAPLVAQKTTFVRVYGRELSGPNVANVEAWLVGERNGAPLPGSPLHPINGVRALTTGSGYDRAYLDDGWYFLLPAGWTQAGPITLRAVVDPRAIHSDPDRNNNTAALSTSFQTQPPVCVWTVPVRTHSPRPSIHDPNFWSMVSHFNRRWPIPDTWIFRDTNPVEELQVCYKYGFIPYPCYGPYELSDGWGITNGPPDRDKVIVSLWTRAQLSFNPDACDNIGAPVHFMGMVHPDADNGGMSGYASLHSNQSWVQLPDHTPNPVANTWNAIREGSTMAQELAHNYGRRHVDCGSPDDVDGSYPYPPCQIAHVGADSYYGFDTVTRQPIRPNQTADFMSYAYRSWVSDYTWRALLGKFLAAFSLQNAGALPTAEPPTSVFVTGWLDTEHNHGQLQQLLVLTTTSVPPSTRQTVYAQAANAGLQAAHGDATYKLRLLDAAGAVLVERTLTPLEMDDHTDDGHSAVFVDLFAPPAAAVAAVQLLADETVIDQRTPGTNAPVVAIQQPAGVVFSDTMTIQWSAADPDPSDALLFTLQYSHDGGNSWHTLALDVPGDPSGSNSLTLADVGSLQGSAAGAARIRVLATDGYNTGSAVSAAFTLADQPPLPVISAPLDRQVLPAGETVVLQGSATDAEDGGLPPENLTWRVNGSPMGSGPGSMAAGLAPGSHTVELAAADSTGKTASVIAVFDIAPLSVPDGPAPVLDGGCEDAAYAASASLPLRAYAADAQAHVRLLHNGNSLWVCFAGLKTGALNPGSYVGLRADVDNSRNPAAQATDIGFFAGEDGDVYMLLGDGAGNWAAGPAAGLQAQVSAGGGVWSAELRIDQSLLGDWGHLAGFAFGHHSVAGAGDDYEWPYGSGWVGPQSWALTALGSQPLITALDPYTATAGASGFTLMVEGSGFISGSQVLWNGSALPTTFVDDSHLTAAVAAPQVAAAGAVSVTVQSPAGGFTSNTALFVVEGSAPVINSISPATLPAGSATQMLTVNGSGFNTGAQVLWNGSPLSTEVLGPTQARAEVPADLLTNGQTAGVAVRNGPPDERISSVMPLEVLMSRPLYLPLISR